MYGEKVRGPYTAIDVCITRQIVLVYRVPGNDRFDRQVTMLASRWDTAVHLVDISHSLSELERINARVQDRRMALARECAPLLGTALYRDGYVAVRVDGHVDRARRVLADLGDGVVVRRTDGYSGNDEARLREVGLEPETPCLRSA